MAQGKLEGLEPTVVGILVVALVALTLLARLRGWLERGPRRLADHSGAPGAGGATHSELYTRYMQSSAWRRRRKRAILRAGRRCQRCHIRAPLDVHHLTYARLGRERDGDLLAVCEPCHQAVHRTRTRSAAA